MKLFGARHLDNRCGIIFDIGSGSVLVAIVLSKKDALFPEIIWSRREQAPLRNVDSMEQSSKAIVTALINVAMALDSEGRRVLHDYDPTLVPLTMQVAISAPWTYSVTRTISYTQEEAFVVTESLLEDLIDTAEDKIATELGGSKLTDEMNLELINSATLSTLANGYRVKDPIGEKALSLKLSHVNVLVQKQLHTAVLEVHEKFFPQTTLQSTSFIFLLYSLIYDLHPSTYDLTLVDITNEATEVGVVRDGVLNFCTHTPFGICSLAREIANITQKPIVEVYGYLQSDSPYDLLKQLPSAQLLEVETVLESYTQKLIEIFAQTGDELTMPQHIYINTDLGNETLFLDIINKAFKRTVKISPVIHSVSDRLLRQNKPLYQLIIDKNLTTDTAMLLFAYFFHKQPKHHDTKFF